MTTHPAPTLSRRALAAGLAALGLAPTAHADAPTFDPRLGLAALDTGTGQRLGHREGERFALCSTFKLVLAASVLSRAERGALDLHQRLEVLPEPPDSYAPVTERVVGRALTLEALCAAAVEASDNGAANLLLGVTDGPEGWTRFVRGLGDEVSRLDRMEPELNDSAPGDPRDTTTPAAYLGLLERLLVGDTLAEGSRKQLLTWMIRCKTGQERLRAGLPRGWRAGDKTGTGPAGEANDVAIVWPPGRAPWLVTAFLRAPDAADGAARNEILADAARSVVSALS